MLNTKKLSRTCLLPEAAARQLVLRQDVPQKSEEDALVMTDAIKLLVLV